MLIDTMAQLNFGVLAIACHDHAAYNARLAAYAAERNILLIPAIERCLEGKHVVVLNPGEAHLTAKTFGDIRKAGRGDAVFIAPHPYYPDTTCLHRKLVEHIDLFDAIEYCSVYTAFCNPNRRAVRVAKRYGLPLVGTSDSHTLPYTSPTFSWIEAEEQTVPAVLHALRKGMITVESQPRPLRQMVRPGAYFVRERVRIALGYRK